MECSCVTVGLDDFARTISDKTRTARKKHKCGECRILIQPGDKYEHYTGVFDGEIFTAKTCNDCLSLRNAFFCEGYYWEQIWNDMHEHIRECNGELAEGKISSLTPIARDKVCGAIEEEWTEG